MVDVLQVSLSINSDQVRKPYESFPPDQDNMAWNTGQWGSDTEKRFNYLEKLGEGAKKDISDFRYFEGETASRLAKLEAFKDKEFAPWKTKTDKRLGDTEKGLQEKLNISDYKANKAKTDGQLDILESFKSGLLSLYDEDRTKVGARFDGLEKRVKGLEYQMIATVNDGDASKNKAEEEKRLRAELGFYAVRPRSISNPVSLPVPGTTPGLGGFAPSLPGSLSYNTQGYGNSFWPYDASDSFDTNVSPALYDNTIQNRHINIPWTQHNANYQPRIQDNRITGPLNQGYNRYFSPSYSFPHYISLPLHTTSSSQQNPSTSKPLPEHRYRYRDRESERDSFNLQQFPTIDFSLTRTTPGGCFSKGRKDKYNFSIGPSGRLKGDSRRKRDQIWT
jgi:hypothetical protein